MCIIISNLKLIPKCLFFINFYNYIQLTCSASDASDVPGAVDVTDMRGVTEHNTISADVGEGGMGGHGGEGHYRPPLWLQRLHCLQSQGAGQ